MGTALLITSAILHAGWNALLKREPDKTVAAVVVLGVAAVVTILAVPLSPAPAFSSRDGWWWGAGAGVCEGAYFLTLAAALTFAPLGRAYTVARGGAMLIVWPVSVLVLGEHAGPWSFIGAASVAAGLAATQLGQAGRLGWAWACAGCIAGYHLCYDRALHAGARAIPLFALSLVVAVPLALAGGRQRRAAFAALRARPVPLVVAGCLSSVSFLAFLVGLAQSGPGAALTLRNTSVVFAQLFAVALGERVGGRQVAAAVLVVVGATLVAMSS